MFSKKLLLFLAGAFSLTQIKIVGYIGISELIMVLAGPFVMLWHWRSLRKDGFLPFILLAGLWIVSAGITDFYRGTYYENSVRGIASPVAVLCVTPCFWWMLRNDVRQFKWAVLGFVATIFLSTYVIQSGASVSFAEFNNLDAREAATEYKLNRMFLITGVMSILPNLFYLIMPTSSLIMTLAMAALALVEGGRSSFLCYMISASIMVMVGRKRGQIKLAANKMISVMIFIVCVTFGAKVIYEAAVSRNLLGEEELSKYEKQAQSKIGLLSGRSHFISVFYAVCDSPILGHGSWALDEKGFEVRAMEWMEDEEGLERYYKTGRIGHIKGHSHIWAAWTWHGVLGAAFWVYVLTIMWRTLSKRMGVVPELFGYFALSIPSFAWAIFFSPFGDRVLLCFTCALCLLIRRIDEVQKRTMAQMDNGILARR